ncbi:MAG: LEA type 2 family protein [Acidobacteriota bacterium]
MLRHAARHPVALCALLLLTTGCATLQLDPPELTLADLALENMTVLETSGTVTIRIANSNPEPLQIDGMAFDLRLDGRKIGKALSDERFEVPRLQSVTVDAAINVSHLALATLIPQWMEAEDVTYDLSGKVYVLTELGRRSLKIRQSGSFDFDGGDADDDAGAPVED